ncbi:MAG TPA: twin-arginine translocase TatA/TatE family subunit [Bacilli bacterium]
MGGIGATGLILIALVGIILFGPSKLPELGRAIGRTLSEFKKGTREALSDDDQQASRKEVGGSDAQYVENGQFKDNKRLPE